LSQFDKQYPSDNSFSEGNTFMSEFTQNVEDELMPHLTLNFSRDQDGRTQSEIVDSNSVQECFCLKGNSMPRLGLQFSTTDDGGTFIDIVDNANDHSFDGGGPIKIGGDHSTDRQYGPAPRMQAPVDEIMDEETRQRIGLAKGSNESMGMPRLVFRKGPDGTISEIV
jgi:hypothetical protein